MDTKIIEIFKSLLLEYPLDVYKNEEDIKTSNIELVEERDVDGEPCRDIGSANLFLASAFLTTVSGFDIPAKSKEDKEQCKILWESMIDKLKLEGFIREKPSYIREGFKVV